MGSYNDDDDDSMAMVMSGRLVDGLSRISSRRIVSPLVNGSRPLTNWLNFKLAQEGKHFTSIAKSLQLVTAKHEIVVTALLSKRIVFSFSKTNP